MQVENDEKHVHKHIIITQWIDCHRPVETVGSNDQGTAAHCAMGVGHGTITSDAGGTR